MSNIYTYEYDVKNIDKIEFCILGNDEIEELSAIQNPEGLTKTENYNNYEPVVGGLIDSRLGTTDIYINCATCGLNEEKCPGHFGHIRLSESVFHLGFLLHIKKILSCICIKCSKLLIYKNEEAINMVLKNKKGKKRFNEIRKLCKNITYCQKENYGCGSIIPSIKKIKTSYTISLVAETNLQFISKDNIQENKKIKEILTPEKCYNILKNISDTDCEILGFNPKINRPEMMIIKLFIVPPISMRPSSKMDNLITISYEDDLTIKISDIILTNLKIKKYKDRDNISINKNSIHHTTDGNLYKALLQFHIGTYYKNDSVPFLKSEMRNGKVLKSISTRLNGKSGRIRLNLMGKRIEFSARTVIGADPYLNINELGVPLKIAMNLTIPEKVTKDNIDRLTEMIKNGKNKYPGANYVISKSLTDPSKSYMIKLAYRKENIILKFGDIVERHLMDGDPIIFNRQPTLHKLSMMAHRIKVIKNKGLSTFKLPLAVTPPYNADFDGDEMNMHVPQNIETAMEIITLGDVKKNIISPGKSSPAIGCVQDTVYGVYLLSKSKVRWDDVMNILQHTTLKKYNIERGKEYTGLELFSMLIPKKINLSNSVITIMDGIIKEGVINKSIVGAQKNGLIHLIWNEYGPNKTQKFIDNVQKMTNSWLLYNGFTIGFSDIFIKEEIQDNVDKLIKTKELEIKCLITNFEDNMDILDNNIFEQNIQSNINAFVADIHNYINKNANDENSFYVTVTSKSKGDIRNLGQITGLVGQQNIEGKRIKKNVNNRTMYHFYSHDDSAYARGLCINSFKRGVSFPEFVFICAAGREGLMDTAIKTADTGYIQKRIIKALEDLVIKYDGTVRNSDDKVIQYVYGNNNIDTIHIINNKLKLINLDNKEIEKQYKFTKNEMSEMKKFTEEDNEKLYNKTIQLRDEIRRIHNIIYMDSVSIIDTFSLFTDLKKIINNNKYTDKKDIKKLEPLYVLSEIERILDSNIINILCMTKKDKENKKSLKKKDDMLYKTLLTIFLYDYLNPKRCIYEYRLNKQQFDNIINNIVNDYRKSKVQPGEMVGIIAAQSIGEPATQMTLNTFHSAGAGTKGIEGVPRLRELLSCTKNSKKPIMKLYMKKKYRENYNKVKNISTNIKNITLKQISDKIELYYDPEPYNNSFRDRDNVKSDFKIQHQTNTSCMSNIELLPWLFRISLNIEAMYDSNITLLDIKSRFCNYWSNKLSNKKSLKKDEKILLDNINNIGISSNYDNTLIPIIHIRIDLNNFDYNYIMDIQKIIIDNFKIKGIKNIKEVDIETKELNIFEKDGSIKKINQNIIVTEGVNISDIIKLKGIDLSKIITTDIVTIYEIYGINAVKTLLENQLNSVVSIGGGICKHHISLLANIITNTGTLTSIDRHGLNKLDTAPLSRASFENTVEQLLESAIFGEVDNMKSISSRIMVGQPIKGGTGLCDIILDVDMIENSEYIEEYDKPLISTFNKINENNIIQDILDKNDIDIYVP